jgi:spermidine/putrescine-binding protein
MSQSRPSRPISRRELLLRLAAAGIAIPGLPVLLAACGSDDGGGADTTVGGGSDTTAAGGADTTAATETTSAAAETTAAAAAGAEELTGTLNFLNFAGWIGKDTYKLFSEKFPGASVNEVPWQSADDAIAKARDRSGDIDLLLVDGTTFPSLDALGVLAEFGDAVPNFSNIDKEFIGRPWDPTNTRFAATDYGRTGLAYRRDLISETPTTWAEFYEIMGKYKGKVGLLDYQRSVMGSVLASLGKNPSSTDEADLKAVGEQLAKIKPNLLALAVEPGKQLASGDLAIAWADAYDVYTAQQNNPDIVWVDPTEGQVAYLEGLAVLSGPREALAKAFVNFALEKDRYADFINTVNSAGVMTTNELIKSELLTSPVLNPGADVRGRITFHAPLGEATAMWQQVWDGFKAA